MQNGMKEVEIEIADLKQLNKGLAEYVWALERKKRHCCAKEEINGQILHWG